MNHPVRPRSKTEYPYVDFACAGRSGERVELEFEFQDAFCPSALVVYDSSVGGWRAVRIVEMRIGDAIQVLCTEPTQGFLPTGVWDKAAGHPIERDAVSFDAIPRGGRLRFVLAFAEDASWLARLYGDWGEAPRREDPQEAASAVTSAEDDETRYNRAARHTAASGADRDDATA